MSRELHTTLSGRLFEATGERFEARAALPVLVAARAGDLPLGSYFAHLAAWQQVWAELEAIAAETRPTVWSDDLSFGGLLRSDRAYLAPLCGAPEPSVEAAASTLVRQVRAACKAERVMFVGVLFALLRLLAESEPLDDCAHRAYGLSFSGRAFWRYQVLGALGRLEALRQRIDALPAQGRAADRVEAAARATLAAYLDIERAVPAGPDLSLFAACRTPPGSLLPPRPNQASGAGSASCGILRGAPHGRRPRGTGRDG